MQTIAQRWLIPKNRRVRIDITLPPDVPEGETDAVIVLSPRTPSLKTKNLMEYVGCLKNSKTFASDPVAIQRKLRDEWE